MLILGPVSRLGVAGGSPPAIPRAQALPGPAGTEAVLWTWPSALRGTGASLRPPSQRTPRRGASHQDAVSAKVDYDVRKYYIKYETFLFCSA